MPALTMQDVGELMRRINETYQPPSGCVATPEKLKILLDRLSEYTDEVQLARNKYKALGVASVAAGPVGLAASELLGGGDVDVAQWRNDMATWQYRLAEYQRHVDAVPSSAKDTVDGCEAIYPMVTAPLLDGIWYQILPGIVLNEQEKGRMREDIGHPAVDVTGDHPGGHSNAKVPDAMTPFSLGNQILVYQDFQREKARKLVEDVVDNFNRVFDPTRWPWWLQAAGVIGLGAAVGVGGLYAYRKLAPKKKNPRRSVQGRSRA